MKPYNKPPLTYSQQVKLLEDRGMMFQDKIKAEQRLATISYYRLSAYMFPFRKNVSGSIVDKFRFGTTWEDVYDLYKFDRKLRLLIFDAIEKIEVAVRCQIVYQLSHKYGSHWQDDSSLFSPTIKVRSDKTQETIDVYKEIQAHIAQQLKNNKPEVFIEHYRQTYDTPSNPPSWMCVEIMYFSQLSRIFTTLANRSDKVGISKFFGLPPEILASWLHTINFIRNLCAHHARMWNREINVEPKLLKYSKSLKWLKDPEKCDTRRIYYFLCMVNYLLQTINPGSSFTSRLKALIKEYPIVKTAAMGFPPNWESGEIWQK